MSSPTSLASLPGQWAGTHRLWLGPGTPEEESQTTLTVESAAQGKFLTLQYTWAQEGAPHDGLLILGQNPDSGAVQASWIDSFHNGDKIMICDGVVNSDGSVSVKGSYSVEGYGEWGWQITLPPPTGDSFTLKMDNIAPDGQVYPAVLANYTRKG